MTKSDANAPISAQGEYLPRCRISIRIKVWAAIMGVVVAVIAGIWIFQVAFLQRSYVNNKKETILESTRQVVRVLNEQGFQSALPELNRIARENTYCIDITRRYDLLIGQEMLCIDMLGDYCFIHSDTMNRREVLWKAVEMGTQYEYSILDFRDATYDTKYFICTSLGETASEEPVEYIVTVSASLAPVKEVAAVIQSQLLYISVGLIVLATLVAFLISRSVTRPLTKISQAAQRIAHGDPDVTVQVKSNDEIGDLGRNFNLMSREISKVNTLQRELVANISHDMRTPLTMIRGYAEMIRDITGDDPAAREEQLDIIIDETNRLSSLVSGVMDLSLMQAGQTVMQLAPFDLSAKGRDILARYRLLEQTEGFRFVLEGPERLWVLGDEPRIEQVLYNLINNAVNHIGPVRQITLRLRTEGDPVLDGIPASEGRFVKVEVEDTGTGIAPEDLPLIWDRYYKPYKKGQKQQGTGLGLSIVKAILIGHHARFGVASTLGVGSTFWFTLALTDPPETTEPPAQP